MRTQNEKRNDDKRACPSHSFGLLRVNGCGFGVKHFSEGGGWLNEFLKKSLGDLVDGESNSISGLS
jgi:hypothetical protein